MPGYWNAHSDRDFEDPHGQAFLQGHYGTKAEADAMAADIEKLCALRGEQVGRIEVERDRQGGWNVWIWEAR